MALTKSDFSQIKTIVQDSVKPLDSRLKRVETKIVNVEKDVQQTKTKLTNVAKDVKKIKKDTSLIVEVFDDDYLKLKARVERIERFLKITPLANL